MMRSIFSACALAFGAAVLAIGDARADDRAVPVQALVETADLSGVSVSPDGGAVAFRQERPSVHSNDFHTDWFILELEGDAQPLRVADGGVPQRTPYGPPIYEAPVWSADSRWVYFRALFGQEVQVWRASRDGAGAEAVTADPANIEAFTLSADGMTVIYRVGATRDEIDIAERDEYAHGIHFDGAIHAGHSLYRSYPLDGTLRSPRFAPGIVSLLSDAPRSYRSVELATGEVSSASPDEVRALEDAVDPAGPDSGARAAVRVGAGLATLSDGVPGTRVSVVVDDGGVPRVCSGCGDLDVDSIAWRDAGTLLVTVRNDAPGFAQSLYLWDVAIDDLRLVSESDGLLSGGREETVPCGVGGHYAVCVHAAPLTPPRLERIDLENGERSVLFEPNAALAAAISETVRAEALRWGDADGNVFSGHLLLPLTHEEPLPLFITYYVCPGFLRGGMGDEWPLITLAGSGVAALCINHPPTEELSIVNYEMGLSGVRSIIETLKGRGVIDDARVGMGGLSFGSETTTWIAGHSDLLAAVSIASAQITPTWYWMWSAQSDFADRAARYWELGSPDRTPEEWARISPAMYAEQIRVPYLLQTPEGEFRPNVELYARLVERGVPTEFWIFPEEMHQKFQPAHRYSANERNLDWFRFWLQDYRTDDPSKREQFERWSSMRQAWEQGRAGATEAPPVRAVGP